METKNTLKALAATKAIAINTADAMHIIAKQETHPTLQLERRQAADRHRHFAHGIQTAVYELHDMHTDDAREMVRHLKHIAKRLERTGMDERLAEHPENAARQLGKATGIRYAAQLLADENGIDVDFDIIHYNEPLQEGGEA
ncbi:MAG: hypothetical protein IKD78_01155 [Bacteroidales bacterium]|nr:hypothetical protein [Bacteroidales bacterium]